MRATFGTADVECGELFAIGGWDGEVFEVGDAELGGGGDFCAGEIGDVGGVDEGSGSLH